MALTSSRYPMPHFCRICHSYLPNERFSGGGHRIHVCKSCQRLPKETRVAIEVAAEMDNFLFNQSNISKNNCKRLQTLCLSSDPKIAEKAQALLAVASVYSHKRKRRQRLAASHPELLRCLDAAWGYEVEDEQSDFEYESVDDAGDEWLNEVPF